ncbi:MAG: hypothetical protein H0T62_03345 [Parachlamydiaceae bacterium]|nr:hypothetical protein [Parachlamydiaceae bacterium]
MKLNKLIPSIFMSLFMCCGLVQAVTPKYEIIELAVKDPEWYLEPTQMAMNDKGNVVFFREGYVYLFTPQDGVKKIKEIPQRNNVEIFKFNNSGVFVGALTTYETDGVSAQIFIYYPKLGFIDLDQIVANSLGIKNEMSLKVHALNDLGMLVFSAFDNENETTIERICAYTPVKGVSVLCQVKNTDSEKKYYKFASLNNKNQVLLRNDEKLSKFLLCELGKQDKNLGDLGLSQLLSQVTEKEFLGNYLKMSAKSCVLNDQGYITGDISNGIIKSDDEYLSSTFIYNPDRSLYVSGLSEYLKGKGSLDQWSKKTNKMLYCFNPLLDNNNRGAFFFVGQNPNNRRDMEKMRTWPIFQWSEKGKIKKIEKPAFKLNRDGDSSPSVYAAALDENGQVQMFGTDKNFQLPKKYESDAFFFIWNEKDGVQYLYDVLPHAQFDQLERSGTEHKYIQMNGRGDILMPGDTSLLLHRIN